MKKLIIHFNNNSISIELIGITFDDFIRTSFFKLYLKRYFIAENNFLIGKYFLTYKDYLKIIELCNIYCNNEGISIHISDKQRDYIDAKENYINIRSKLGLEIKSGSDKFDNLLDKFNTFLQNSLKRPLRALQVKDAFFMLMMKRSGNFSVPGSGKTASILGTYTFLKSRGKLSRIIVICPKNAFGSWIDEFITTTFSEEGTIL